jgi:hypothetical protein
MLSKNLQEFQKEVQSLKKAIVLADSWLRASEGVGLPYYALEYLDSQEDKEANLLITKILKESLT